MLGGAKVSVFLATTQPAASRAFYTDVLGLEFVEEDDFTLLFNMANSELRMSKVEEFTAQPFTVLDWQVENIQQAVSALKSKGITFIVYDFIDQDDEAIWTVPGGQTQIAWFKDPDDNVLSVSQRG